MKFFSRFYVAIIHGNFREFTYTPKGDEIIGGWRKLHNEELHNLYSSSNIIRTIKLRRMRWARHVARMWKRNAYRILVAEPEGKRLLGKPRRT
jgi:hypothetical protein